MSSAILNLLQERVIFTVTNRLGGNSQSPYYSLNLAYHVGDCAAHVVENRKKILTKLGLYDRPLVFMNQIHKNDVFIVLQKPDDLELQVTADALVTQRIDVALLVMVADCNPILVYDYKNHVLGLIHAGRKGVELYILTETLRAMKEYFGTNLKNIYGVIGPSIRSCCYEIGLDVAQPFLSSIFPAYIINNKKGRYYLDLPAALRYEWELAGANPDFLWIDQTCTACSNDYYSFRRDKQCGRFGIIAGLKNK